MHEGLGQALEIERIHTHSARIAVCAASGGTYDDIDGACDFRASAIRSPKCRTTAMCMAPGETALCRRT